MQNVTEWRIVQYMLKEGRSAGQLRPAIIVNAHADGGGPEGIVNLVVFLDGSNDTGCEFHTDTAAVTPISAWAPSVHFDEPSKTSAERVSSGGRAPGHQPGTWHWPART